MFRPNPLKQCCVKIDQLNFCKQFLIYRKVTTPSLSYAHAQCRNPKKVSKKVATLEKTTFLYRSKSLISLWILLKLICIINKFTIILCLSIRIFHIIDEDSDPPLLERVNFCDTMYNCTYVMLYYSYSLYTQHS